MANFLQESDLLQALAPYLNGKENGNYRGYRDYIGVIIREYKVYFGGSKGIMEKKMETTRMENQMEKNMENEMETREYIGFRVRV